MRFNDLEVGALVKAADVVGLADAALGEGRVQMAEAWSST